MTELGLVGIDAFWRIVLIPAVIGPSCEGQETSSLTPALFLVCSNRVWFYLSITCAGPLGQPLASVVVLRMLFLQGQEHQVHS
jgi:hypothetical protein